MPITTKAQRHKGFMAHYVHPQKIARNRRLCIKRRVALLVEIIGYIGKRNAIPILLRGLRSLESSEYDSVGIAILSDSLKICKGVGRMDMAVKESDLKNLLGNIGIAHTRRATHGRVCTANAHPHTDCTGRIAIAHNGIISNYKDLKRRLINQGHKFASSTDSEVIAHLIEEKTKRCSSFQNSCIEAFQELEGCYSVLVISEDPRRIAAFRRDMPLAIGLVDHGFIFASSEPAIRELSKRVAYIQNNSMAIACKKEVIMHNI